MSGESSAYTQDIRWFHGEISRKRMNKPPEGAGSAFAERVAIKLDGNTDFESVAKARQEAFLEWWKCAANEKRNDGE